MALIIPDLIPEVLDYDSSSFETALEFLKSESSTNSINAHFEDKLLLSQPTIDSLNRMIKDLEQILCDEGFKCHLNIFGSVASLLAFKNQFDTDVFARVDALDLDQCKTNCRNQQLIKKILKNLSTIIKNKQHILFPFGIYFQTICHPHMRVPLLRLTINTELADVSDTGEILVKTIKCDINVNCGLGLRNTELIRFLCDFEPRFKAVTILVRLWLRDVVQVKPPKGLSPYAATLLVLFYFQTLRILPPIRLLMASSPESRIITNGWRTDFCSDPNSIDFMTTNNDSVLQLLKGYFQFYANFDFFHRYISTRDGRSLRKRNKFSNAMQLMDPFDLSHNVTAKLNLPPMIDHFNSSVKFFDNF